jgi:hypothetical protein
MSIPLPQHLKVGSPFAVQSDGCAHSTAKVQVVS